MILVYFQTAVLATFVTMGFNQDVNDLRDLQDFQSLQNLGDLQDLHDLQGLQAPKPNNRLSILFEGLRELLSIAFIFVLYLLRFFKASSNKKGGMNYS